MTTEQRRPIKSPAIYTRKSKLTGKGDSIGNQVEECKKYIKFYYPDLQDSDITIFEDEGYSGGNTSRPQFQEMMKGVRERKYDAIVCYRLDRLTRNVGDFALLYNELEKYNAEFISTTESFDTASPAGRMMLTVCAAFAEMERATIAERIRDNMIGLAKTGRWLGGTTPTGYKSVETKRIAYDGKYRSAHKLEIIQNEAELIRLIFKLFLEYGSLTKVETYLLQNHIKTRNHKSFTRFAIKSILQNPVYMIADIRAWDYFEALGVEVFAKKADFDGTHGIMAYNKTMQNTHKSHESRDINEWIIALGDHYGLISSEDWIKTANLLEQNKSKAYRKVRSHEALLSGLLICGKCGSYMRPKKSQRLNANGEYIYSYLCETKEKSHQHNCAVKNPNGNTLDKLVCEQIRMLSEDNEYFIGLIESERRKIQDSSNDYLSQIENKKKIIRENEASIQKLIDSITLTEAGGSKAYELIVEKINSLNTENEILQEQITELIQISESQNLSEAQFDVTCEMLRRFSVMFDEMSIDEKRNALKCLIKRVVWDGVNASIILFASDDPDDPTSNSFEGENENGDLEPLRGDCK